MQATKLEKIMKESKYDSLSEDFNELVAEINRIEPQKPDMNDTKRHKLNILYESVINNNWLT